MDILTKFKRGLIVSCQAQIGEPLHVEGYMARMALAAQLGGAHAIRAESPQDIAAIRKVVNIPIIGLYKYHYPSFEPFITPTFTEAVAIAESGADIIALDATLRTRPVQSTEELIHRIHHELQLPVLADIATVEEARAAREAGADIIATTLRGCTPYTNEIDMPDVGFVQELIKILDCPVIAEGGVRRPEQAADLIKAGAFAVVVGTAITRPQEITRWYVDALHDM